MKTHTAIAFATVLGSACGEAEPESPTQQLSGSDQPAAHDLWDLNFSDEHVAKMTRDDLWRIGVERLGWPQQMPDDADKAALHQRLLEAKYKGVGDFPGLDLEHLQRLGYVE